MDSMWKMEQNDFEVEMRSQIDIFEEIEAGLVFARKPKLNFDHVSMDGRMLKVLLELDGTKTLRRVSNTLGLDMKTLKDTINDLYRLSLIDRVSGERQRVASRKRMGNWRGASADLH